MCQEKNWSKFKSCKNLISITQAFPSWGKYIGHVPLEGKYFPIACNGVLIGKTSQRDKSKSGPYIISSIRDIRATTDTSRFIFRGNIF